MVQNRLLEPMVSMPHTKLMAVDRGGIYTYMDVYMYIIIYIYIYVCISERTCTKRLTMVIFV